MRSALFRRACIPFALSAAVLTAAVAPAGATQSQPRAPVLYKMCKEYANRVVTDSAGMRFVIRNDYFPGDRECIRNENLWSNFKVVSSAARSASPEAAAFPEEFFGCEWGICTPGPLPVRISRAGRAKSSWYTTQRAGGRWDAAYDIWFSRHEHTGGQAKAAEVMIWLGTRGFGTPPPNRRIVRIDGARWWLDNWRACNAAGSGCWNYVQFRRVHPVRAVRGLHLGPFFQFTERHGLLQRSDWLESISAGFEIWDGGKGLGTRSFRATI